MAEKTVQIFREGIIWHYFFLFLKKGTLRKFFLFKKEREYYCVEKFGLAGINSLQISQNDKVITAETCI